MQDALCVLQERLQPPKSLMHDELKQASTIVRSVNVSCEKCKEFKTRPQTIALGRHARDTTQQAIRRKEAPLFKQTK